MTNRMSDLARVMQKKYVPKDEYEQILRFLGWLNNFAYVKSGYEPTTLLGAKLLQRIARSLANTKSDE